MPSKGEPEASGIEPNESVRSSIGIHFVSKYLSFSLLYVLSRTLGRTFQTVLLSISPLNLSFISILYQIKSLIAHTGLTEVKYASTTITPGLVSQLNRLHFFFQDEPDFKDALSAKLGLNSDSDDPEFAKKQFSFMEPKILIFWCVVQCRK